MNAKTTVLLLLLLIAVGAYIAFIELDRETTRQRESRLAEVDAAAGEPLLDPEAFTADAVASVTLSRNGEAMTMTRDASEPSDGDVGGNSRGSFRGNFRGWWQTEPVRFPLRRFPIEDLVSAAVNLRAYQSFTPGADEHPAAGDLGFADDPGAPDARHTTVTLTTDGGDSRTLEFGRRGVKDRAYVRFADEAGRVYAVGAGLHRQLLEKEAADFRLKRTETQGFTVPEQADRITLTRAGETIALHRIDGRWYLNDRATERADADAVDDLATAAGEIGIDAFITDAPESLSFYGLAEPGTVITLEADLPAPTPSDEADASDETAGDDEAEADAVTRTHRVEIGGAADLDESTRYARWLIDGGDSPVVFTARASSLESLNASIDDLRDPAIVLTDTGELSEVTLDRDARPLIHLRRGDDGQWRFADAMNTEDDAGRSPVRAWLAAVTDLSSSGFAAVPEGEPTMRLELYAAGGTELVRVYDTGEGLVAVRGNETIGYRLDEDAAEPLKVTPLQLVDRTLLDVDPSTLAEVRLTQADGAELVLLRDAEAEDEAAWTLRGHDGFERPALDALLETLSPLRADDWLEESVVLEGEGVIELTLVDGEGESRTLRVDPESRRGTAGFADYDFTLPASVIEAWSAELRPRTVLPLEGDEITRVTIDRAEAEPVTVRREDGGFASDAGPVDEQAAAALFDRLSGLRVERHVPGDGERRAMSLINFETAGGKRHEVQLAEPFTETMTLHVDDRGWYRVSDAAVEDLTGDVIEGE